MPENPLAIIWSHRPYSLYVMSMAAEATVFNFKKIFPQSTIDYGVNYYQKGQNTYLYPQKQYLDTANALARQAADNPEFILKTLKTAFSKSLTLNKYSRLFTPVKIKKAKTETLISWIQDFSQLFIDMYAFGTVAILVGYSQDNVLYQTAEKILNRKMPKKAGAFADLYVALTNQPQMNRNVDFELAVIRLARRVAKEKNKKIAHVQKKYRSEIRKLLDRYRWLSYDLCDGLAWDEKYIAHLLIEKSDPGLDGRYQSLLSYNKRTKALFLKAVCELHLNKKEINVFEAIRNLAYYKWAREYEFTEALYRLKFVHDELARRLKIGRTAIKYLLPSEYPLLLEQVSWYRVELPKRINNCLWSGGSAVGERLISGQLAAQEWRRIEPVHKNSKSKNQSVKGATAYGGVVKGHVKIVNSVRHISKISQGDILISVTTSPALLPAMKKAAAIVTNEGGITSHAAIVSRELQIPCVVGARNATNIFKDGDMVEVDAKHGIVQKINF